MKKIYRMHLHSLNLEKYTEQLKLKLLKLNLLIDRICFIT
jgi:hypothetical protein